MEVELRKFGSQVYVSGPKEVLKWIRSQYRLPHTRYLRGNKTIQEYLPLYRNHGKGLLLPPGLLESLLYHLAQSPYRISHLDPELFLKPDFEPIEKWKAILRPDQLEALKKLLRYPRGILRAYTGWGKTEVQLALAESYLQSHPEDHLAVLVPTRAILEEWAYRMRRWQVSGEERVHLIIPQGWVRSRHKDDIPKERILMVLADEMHHLSAKTWVETISSFPNLLWSYGFSATPDPDRNASTDPQAGFPFNATYAYGLRVGASGPIRVFITSKEHRSLDLHFISLPPRPYDLNGAKYIDALDLFWHEIPWEAIFSSLEPEDRIYVPCHRIEFAQDLYDRLSAKGYPIAFWQAKGIQALGVEMDFGELKDAVDSGAVRILLTTSVAYEGVDMPSVNSVLLYHGSNWRMTLQPLGRARRDAIKLFIPYNFHPLLKKGFRSRIQQVVLDYEVRSLHHWSPSGDSLQPSPPSKMLAKSVLPLLGKDNLFLR